MAPVAKKPRLSGERTGLACVGCKQKKLKCDSQIPRCQNCIRLDRECLAEDPSSGQHRPRNYVQLLEERVQDLEAQLRRHTEQSHSVRLPAPVSGQRPTIYGSNTTPTLSLQDGNSTIPLADLSEQSDADRIHDQRMDIGVASQPEVTNQTESRLQSKVALLCVSATGCEPQYFGPSSAISFSRIVSSAMGLDRDDGGGQLQGAARSSSAQKPISEDNLLELFPDRHLAMRLAQAYWTCIHPQYPFLHRPTVQALEMECWDANEAGKLREVRATAIFFTLMVYAIGSLALGQTGLEAAENLYSLSTVYLTPILNANSLESVQALLCCAVFSIKSPAGVNLWKASGLIMRYCIELGYHRSANAYRKQSNCLTKEMSRRCFWVAYDIDRVVALILGRPLGIPDSAIDAELPLDMNDEDIAASGYMRNPRDPQTEPPTDITGAIHIIKLRRLWSKFADCLSLSGNTTVPYIQNNVQFLRSELEQWRAAIPNALPSTFAPQAMAVWNSQEWFHVAYHYSVLLLHRFCSTTPTENKSDLDERSLAQPTNQTSHRLPQIIAESSVDDCLAHAREICLCYRRLYRHQSVQFTWGSLHILFLGGLTYLYCLWQSKRVRQNVKLVEVVETSMACSSVLITIAERWKNATAYRDIFEHLAQRTIGMVCSANDQRDPTPSQTVSETVSQQAGVGGNATSTNDLHPDWVADLFNIGGLEDSEWLIQGLLGEAQGLYSHD